MEHLPIPESYYYLASPYSKYPDGHEAAFERISTIAGALIHNGIPVFAPISHSHPIALQSEIPLNDYETWLGLDKRFIAASGGVLVAKMQGWQYSYGVNWEIKRADELGLPVLYVAPEELSPAFKGW